MKKKIEMLSVSRAFLSRLSDCVLQHMGQEGSDFAAALGELEDGSCESLLLETDSDAAARSDCLIRCGDIAIYTLSRRVTRDGEEIVLTPKEFDILCFLARNRGEVFTKEQIYKAVWKEDYLLDSSNIMAFIRKIRKKIEPNPDVPRYILTVWGIGYKFSDRF